MSKVIIIHNCEQCPHSESEVVEYQDDTTRRLLCSKNGMYVGEDIPNECPLENK
jgi:hypothetical protein